jgi:23S rRNA (cytosine1962-C5)-methyltransferase
MPIIKPRSSSPIKLQLSRNLVKMVKRGHAWIYPDALRKLPNAPQGSHAILLDNRGGREIAKGYYDPAGAIALRICSTQTGENLDEAWAERQFNLALEIRNRLFDNSTTGYRLFNGEGDGLPGLVCDVYDSSAVLKFDGEAAESFWDAQGIGEWLQDSLGIGQVFQRFRRDRTERGTPIIGSLPEKPIHFLENDIKFTADLIHGQKTGFFLDQRENRARIKPLAKEKSVLNLYGYTGGFSVYAGLGGAPHVTTVDSAKPAIEAAKEHWALNQLDPDIHEAIPADVFDFLETQIKNGRSWDIVIADPPSFAPSQAAVPQAVAAYKKLIAQCAQITEKNGILAASSCSSHIPPALFLELCQEGISTARRKATLLGSFGQPADHPAPLVMPELHYLKFVLLKLD